MQVNVALDYDLIKSTYPFCRLTGPANVLVMPSLHAANISQKLLTEFADGTVIGPVLQGLNHAVQITSMNAKVSDAQRCGFRSDRECPKIVRILFIIRLTCG